MKKYLTTLAMLTVFATPAFAQSFDPDTGTGNVLAFSHTPTAHQNGKIAGGRRGLHSFAMVPSSRSDFDSENSQATGGGSIGYNEMLRSF
jgi:hypothetical protein